MKPHEGGKVANREIRMEGHRGEVLIPRECFVEFLGQLEPDDNRQVIPRWLWGAAIRGGESLDSMRRNFVVCDKPFTPKAKK